MDVDFLFEYVIGYTINFRYTAAENKTILKTIRQEESQNFVQTTISQKMSIVRIVEEIDHVISRVHCIWCGESGGGGGLHMSQVT